MEIPISQHLLDLGAQTERTYLALRYIQYLFTGRYAYDAEVAEAGTLLRQAMLGAEDATVAMVGAGNSIRRMEDNGAQSSVQ